MPAIEDMTGLGFGMLDVIAQAGRHSHGEVLWRCSCRACGREVVVRGSRLRSGRNTSCGCRGVNRMLPGVPGESLRKGRLHRVWSKMRERCDNPRHDSFHNYGGRGVMVCAEWAGDYLVFRDWALSHGYRDGLTIERRDVNGDYTPFNCTWIPAGDQQAGRRNIGPVLRGDGQCFPTPSAAAASVDGTYRDMVAACTRGGTYLGFTWRFINRAAFKALGGYRAVPAMPTGRDTIGVACTV